MSGGVDSSVAAHLMKEKGYECLGVTMRLYDKECGCSCQKEFVSKDIEDKLAAESEAPIGIFDCEVFPNFWCLCAKKYHEEIWDVLINPTPAEVEAVVNKYRLIGFNNLKYDNNICYVAINGYNIDICKKAK